MNNTQHLRQQLAQLLQRSNAHADFNVSIARLDAHSRGIKLPHLPYSIWQLVEHIRIAQQDILEFSVDKNYQPLKWPEGYWPEEQAPSSEEEWEKSLQEIQKSLADFTALILNEQQDLLTPFAHGDGQNLFREAILIIDHLSYHTGQIVLIRRLLENWDG